MTQHVDCVIIGYYETPFADYEAMLRRYGEDSEAYRDLRMSAVEVGDRLLTYVDLLNEVLPHAGNGDRQELRSGDIPNLAAVYLVSFLRRHGLSAAYVNLFQHEKQRLRDLLDRRPTCVAITTTFYVTALPVIEIVEFLRAYAPGVPIVVGGPLVGNYAERLSPEYLPAALAEMGADIYVHDAQGEATLVALIRALQAGSSLADVPNLVYMTTDATARTTPRRPETNAMDECAIDWLAFSDDGLGPTLQTRTARSCAFNCAFCSYPRRAGKLSLASLETVAGELDAMRELGGVRNVVFIDDTFNVPLARFKALCRLMIERDYGFRWFSYFRCGNADEEAVELMAEAGCAGVFLGIESGSPCLLRNMHKVATVEQYDQGVKWLRKSDILTFASLIIGFPGETRETVDETIDFLERARPDYFRAQLWYCEPGTPIEAQRDRYSITGSGFKWRHSTMASADATAEVERVRREVCGSLWLPQWSFDFWIIPYLLGKGMSLTDFHRFMTEADRLQMLAFDRPPGDRREAAELEILGRMVAEARAWATSTTTKGL